MLSLVGSHISLTIKAEEQNTKLPVPVLTKLCSPTTAETAGEKKQNIFLISCRHQGEDIKTSEVNGLLTWHITISG